MVTVCPVEASKCTSRCHAYVRESFSSTAFAKQIRGAILPSVALVSGQPSSNSRPRLYLEQSWGLIRQHAGSNRRQYIDDC